jgi:acyl carrier protein
MNDRPMNDRPMNDRPMNNRPINDRPMNDVGTVIAEALSAILRRPVSLGDKVVRETEPKWDSLAHVEIVFTLEDAFGITFDESEIIEMTDSEVLKSLVERKYAS